jgi:hypothetical protein
VKVHRRITRIVGRRLVVVALLLEALERRPRFDERSVDREVIGAHQLRLARLLDDQAKKLARYVVGDQSATIVGEDGRHEAPLHHVHVEKPAKQ